MNHVGFRPLIISVVIFLTCHTLNSQAAPTARNDSATTTKNASVVVPVLANDSGKQLKVIAIVPGSERRGRALITADQQRVIFMPERNYIGNKGRFKYQVEDTTGKKTATVTITVKNSNNDDDNDDNGDSDDNNEPPLPIIEVPENTTPIDSDQTPFLSLAQGPLEQSLSVAPNVLIIGDDSGSMDFDMSINGEGVFQEPGFFGFYYSYVLPYDNLFKSGTLSNVAPSEESVTQINPALAAQLGIWRTRNSAFNKIYYDPSVRYTPWVGKNLFDQPYSDIDPFRAPIDPNDLSERVDLTRAIFYRAVLSNGQAFIVQNYYTPRYYVHSDSNGNGQVDANDSHTLIEIKPGRSYQGSALRSDCQALADAPFVCSYDEELRNFANWFSYYRRRQYILKAALGQTLELTDGIRIGYSVLNSSATRIPIQSLNLAIDNGAKKDLLSTIYSTRASGGTPLRRALDGAGRYFSCKSGNSFGNNNSVPGQSTCPILPAPAGQCQQNYTILFTDGARNGGDTGIKNSDGDNNTSFDGGAFSDAISDTLADIAMHYYERDLFPNLANQVKVSKRDLALADEAVFSDQLLMHQHMTTYTVGFGVNGLLSDQDEPIDFTSAFTWPNPNQGVREKIDDLRHAAYNGRGRYLSSTNPVALAKDFNRIFSELNSSKGSATKIVFNDLSLNDQTLALSTSYNIELNTGDLIASTINVDSNNQAVLSKIWSASERLDAALADERVIISYDPIADPKQGIGFRFEQLNVFQQQLLSNNKVDYLRGERSLEQPNGEFRTRPSRNGLLGDIVNSTPVVVVPPSAINRDRAPYPLALGQRYSEFKTENSDRPSIVYVGASDGMLHGFHLNAHAPDGVVAGDELFAYIPDRVINSNTQSPNIAQTSNQLASLTDPLYDHKFFVNLTPTVEDVFIRPNRLSSDSILDKRWSTILIGGLGAGGRGYFALNVTDPSRFINEEQAALNVLWEFSDRDDADLGFSVTKPTISLSNYQESGLNQWVAIFGNGINSDTNKAALFVLLIDKGIDGQWSLDDYTKIVLEDELTVSKANGLGTPRAVDLDANGTVDLVYAGDRLGNLYRFDLRSENRNDWTGKRIYTSEYTPQIRQPIFQQPIVVRNPIDTDTLIVVFTTGSYITDGANGDRISSEIQSIYGIWDTLTANHFVNKFDLVEQEYMNVQDPTLGNIRLLTDRDIDWSREKGWFIDLDLAKAGQTSGIEFPGEKAIRNLQLKSDLLFVNTIIPRQASSCDANPGGFALALNPVTGGMRPSANQSSIFDINNDGTFDDSDMVNANVVMGFRFNDGVPTDSSFLDNRRFTQLSNQDLHSISVNIDDGLQTGRYAWRELPEVVR